MPLPDQAGNRMRFEPGLATHRSRERLSRLGTSGVAAFVIESMTPAVR
jgi:hypothetical protein